MPWPVLTCLQKGGSRNDFSFLVPEFAGAPFSVEEIFLFCFLFFSNSDLQRGCSLVLRCHGFGVLGSETLGRVFFKNHEFMFKALVETHHYSLFTCASGPWFHTYSAGPVDSSCTLRLGQPQSAIHGGALLGLGYCQLKC